MCAPIRGVANLRVCLRYTGVVYLCISTKTYQNAFLLNHGVISKKAGHNVLFNNVTASHNTCGV